jgi:hypothetical protein
LLTLSADSRIALKKDKQQIAHTPIRMQIRILWALMPHLPFQVNVRDLHSDGKRQNNAFYVSLATLAGRPISVIASLSPVGRCKGTTKSPNRKAIRGIVVEDIKNTG